MCMIVFVGMNSHAIGFDLTEQIASKFQSFYNKGSSNDYLLNAYSPKFSKDPFGDAMSNIENRSIQLKVAGAEYVEQLLQKKGCSNMSKKKIWGILYYFVPKFRSELARSLKQEIGDYDSQKYVLNDGTIQDYCKEYYICVQSEGHSVREIFKDEVIKGKDSIGISSASAENVMTNCKEFFITNYELGQNNKEIIQNVEVSQAGGDKYWNNSTDDSPYDIMIDLGILSKLLYESAQDPTTSVFYNIPVFSNSAKSLNNKKDSDGVSNNNSSNVKGSNVGEEDGLENVQDIEKNGVGSDGVSLNEGNGPKVDSQKIEKGGDVVKPLGNGVDKRGGYEELVEGLRLYSIENGKSNLYSNVCEDGTESSEVEFNDISERSYDESTFSELSDDEYQEIVDYMVDAVNQYSSVPKDIEENIQKEYGSMSDSIGKATTSSDLENVANEIKNCYKSCDGLRIDQKASCMLKCSCGEIKSPIFDPEKTPGLGPIFLVRFCGVPAVNTKFSVGGRRIHSIEEGMNEIYGVVDKLSREGKLGKWTQQYEFLDSSTKQMNVANTFAFTIDVELVDIGGRNKTQSVQYEKKQIINSNEEAESLYGISNFVDNPSEKNVYRVDSDSLNNYGERLKPAVDFLEDSKASRYSITEETFSNWIDQQSILWKKIIDVFSDLNDYSNTLYVKKAK